MPAGDGRARLFVAWFPGREVLGRLADPLLERMAAIGRRIPDANRHLTVLFIGDTPEKDLPDVCAAVGRTAAAHRPFTLEPDGITVRGSGRRPMLWAQYRPHPAFRSLRCRLAQSVAPASPPPEPGDPVPHVTLFRFPPGSRAKAKDAARECAGLAVPLAVDHIALVRSRLTKEGSIYTVLAKRALGAPPGD